MSGELPMPMWPQSEDYVCRSTVTPCHPCGHAYEKALRLAWEARARKMYQALISLDGPVHAARKRAMHQWYELDNSSGAWGEQVELLTEAESTLDEALAAIGELPGGG